MHRYSVDNAVTYSADDLVLFRESPFAAWMERLTLEDPGHQIAPDPGSEPPTPYARPQNAFADTLRERGRACVQIDWSLPEPERRARTLEAMRQGADYIVDGLVAVGSLAGTANLLMRVSGLSELGDFLYLPCDTQGEPSVHLGLRLAFLADLLHSIQGQLPPQLLVIERGLEQWATEEHIFYYRAVKHRFMLAQRNFRKHRMPDPAESSHFGRWTMCANDVARQRLTSRERPQEDGYITAEQTPEALAEQPVLPQLLAAEGSRAAEGSSRMAEGSSRMAEGSPAAEGAYVAQDFRTAEGSRYDLDSVPVLRRRQRGMSPRGETLAEQAQQLGPNPASAEGAAGYGRLEPLAYIGASSRVPELMRETWEGKGQWPKPGRRAPGPVLDISDHDRDLSPVDDDRAAPAQRPHPLDSPGFSISAHARLRAQRGDIAGPGLVSSGYELDDPGQASPGQASPGQEAPGRRKRREQRPGVEEPGERAPAPPPFGARLNTRDGFEESS